MCVSMLCFKTFLQAWPHRLLLAVCLLLPAFAASAHKSSDAYLQLSRSEAGLTLRWDIALRDLDAALLLDRNDDRNITWGEVKAKLPEIEQLARQGLELNGGQCPLQLQSHGFERRVDGVYIALHWLAVCQPALAESPAQAENLRIHYRLFADIDPTHRGLLRVDGPQGGRVVSLDPTAAEQTVLLPALRSALTRPKPNIDEILPAIEQSVKLQLAAAPQVDTQAQAQAQAQADAARSGLSGNFLRDGITHILGGYDHVLFLICLLLPAVLRPGGVPKNAVPSSSAAQTGLSVLAIVSLFTLAHSLTLVLAGLKLIHVSSQLIEPAIALTILATALDNIWPFMRANRKLCTFGFGLIHGFGFAEVLTELDLPRWEFAKALLQFNLGVELGQLLVVALGLAMLWPLRRQRWYGRAVLGGGSLLAGVAATLWLTERVFNLRLMPF